MSVPQLRFKDDAGRDFSVWRNVKLSKLVKVFDGTHMTPEYKTSGVPFYSVEHLTRNNFDVTKFISEEVFEKENKRVKLEKGDILMTRIGDIGTARYIDWDVRASFYVSLALIKQSPSIHSLFLAHSIEAPYFQKELHQRIIHVAFPKKINLGEISECLVQLPCEAEQTKIASFLTAVDEKISQITRKHDLLTQYKKGVMQQIFSQELRFKDDNGCDFPEWEECTIGEMATQKAKKLSPENANVDLRCIELEHISQITGQLLGYVDASKQKSLKSQFSKGDVLFGKLRPYLRKYLKAPFDGVCSTEIWVLRGRKVSNDYLFYFVQAERFLTVANISSGSKMPRADWNVVASDEVEIPCKAEQTKIANFLTAIDEKISATKAQLEAIKQYKQGLLQQMFV